MATGSSSSFVGHLLLGGCLLSSACSLEDPSFVPTTMNLPVLTLTTVGQTPVASREDSVVGALSIANVPDGGFDGPMSIRGHGNSSWGWPKKPYKLKLDAKAALLGMPASKDWLLLANYVDKSLLRNSVAFELSRQLGSAYTPRSTFVELFLNGQYEGVYQLTEQIKVASTRVDLSDQGYLLEIEPPTADHRYFDTPSGISVGVQQPDPPSDEQLQSIDQQLQSMEAALGSAAQGQFLDEDAAIAWYWTNELFKNVDAQIAKDMTRSVYLSKEPTGPVKLGPVWDFDLGAGNIDEHGCDDPHGYWVRQSAWFTPLFADPDFAAKAEARWHTVDVAALVAFVEQSAAALDQGQQNNFRRWTVLGRRLRYNSSATGGTWRAELDALEQWLTTRAQWVDQNP